MTRTLTAKVPITPTYTQPLNNPAWDFIYATRTGNACDMTLSNNVLGAARLYVEGNFCLSNNSTIQISSLVVRGNVDIANNGSGRLELEHEHPRRGLRRRHCRYGGGALGDADCAGNQDARHIYGEEGRPELGGRRESDASGRRARPDGGLRRVVRASRARPHDRLHERQRRAQRDRVPIFDNDTLLNNSVPTAFDLTPASSYTCRVGPPTSPAGELSGTRPRRRSQI